MNLAIESKLPMQSSIFPTTRLDSNSPNRSEAETQPIPTAVLVLPIGVECVLPPIQSKHISKLVTDHELDARRKEALSKARQRLSGLAYDQNELMPAALRLRKGLSQKALANLAHTSQPYIARIENGRVDPQLSTAKRIAEVLNVGIETFSQAVINAQTKAAEKFGK